MPDIAIGTTSLIPRIGDNPIIKVYSGTETIWGGDIDVPITGESLSGSLGSLSVQTDSNVTVAIGSILMTSTAGTATADTTGNIDVDINGVAATSATGTASVTTTDNVTVPVTGVAATGAVGDADVDTTGNEDVFPTGVSGTGSVGTMSVDIGVEAPATGVAATASTGDAGVQISVDVAITGTGMTSIADDVGSVDTTPKVIYFDPDPATAAGDWTETNMSVTVDSGVGLLFTCDIANFAVANLVHTVTARQWYQFEFTSGTQSVGYTLGVDNSVGDDLYAYVDFPASTYNDVDVFTDDTGFDVYYSGFLRPLGSTARCEEIKITEYIHTNAYSDPASPPGNANNDTDWSGDNGNSDVINILAGLRLDWTGLTGTCEGSLDISGITASQKYGIAMLFVDGNASNTEEIKISDNIGTLLDWTALPDYITADKLVQHVVTTNASATTLTIHLRFEAEGIAGRMDFTDIQVDKLDLT